MMICECCGHVFEDEDAAGGEMIYSGSEINPPEFAEPRCPECGSEDIEEADRCPVCGKWATSWDLRGGLCGDCINALADAIDGLVMERLGEGIQSHDAKEALIEYIQEEWDD